VDPRGHIRVDGGKIRSLRKELRLTACALAALVPGRSDGKLSTRQLSNIETGRVPSVHARTFSGFLKALRATPDQILFVEQDHAGFHREPTDPLKATVTFVDGSDESEELLESSFAVYEELFPDDAERSDPDHIRTWLAESRTARLNGTPWRELWGVLHVDKTVIGISYFSGHESRQWFFASYFGVKASGNSYAVAEKFLLELSISLKATLPAARGVIFEANSIDLTLLRRADRRSKVGRGKDHAAVIASLRAAKRLWSYESYLCLTVLDGNGNPVPFWQPAMDKAQSEEKQRVLTLMVYLFDFELRDRILSGQTPSGPLVSEIVNFSYDDVYAASYAGFPSTRIADFAERLKDVKAKTSNFSGVWSLGFRHMDREDKGLIKRLLARAKKEGWSEELHL
jgi:hypothetical protein